MDEAAIEAAGAKPIQPQLDKIAALHSGKDVAAYIISRHGEGDAQVFAFGAGADFHNADQQIAFTQEGGLGLPTKDYYTGAEHAPIRAAYLAYIAKSFELTGTPAALATTQANDVLALETRLAAASLAPVDAREPKNQYRLVTLAEADKLTPHFPWEDFSPPKAYRSAAASRSRSHGFLPRSIRHWPARPLRSGRPTYASMRSMTHPRA